MRSIHFGSVRTRLTLWNAAVVALSLVLFGIALRYSVKQILYGGIDRMLGERIRPFVEHIAHPENGPRPQGPEDQGFPPGEEGPPPERRPRPQDGGGWGRLQQRPFPLAQGPPRIGPRDLPPRAYDRESRDLHQGIAVAPWSDTGYHDSLDGRTEYVTALYEGEQARILSMPLWRDGRLIGVAQIGTRVGETERALDGITAALFLLIPVVLLVAGAGGLLLTDRALRPVRDISEAADQISERRLSERLPSVGGDEFARLAGVLNGMLSRLESAFSRQRRFSADASHELKTPLAIIKAHSSLALDEELTPAEYQAALATIDRATDRASRIVRDLLQLARLESNALPLEWSTFSARSLLEEAVEAAGLNGDQRLAWNSIPGDLSLSGDRHQLVRLFSNLLENAARYTSEGHITISVYRNDKDSATVLIADTGTGIAAEHLPHLFEPFYRADSARTRQTGGAGLGLAICKEIAEANGGAISIESAPGTGTTVSVRLRTSQGMPTIRVE